MRVRDEAGLMAARDPEGELETALLRHDRRYTSREVARLAGVPVYRARRFWRALGFANVDDDAVEFTDADVGALSALLRLVDEGFEEGQALQLARSLGRSAARLAEAQAELVMELMERVGVPPGGRAHHLAARLPELLPELEGLLVYTWRRQLAVSTGRLEQVEPGTTAARWAVGFADLVGFTRLSRRLGERELGLLVERFEGRSADVVTAGRGRVIKTLGDSVMFVADSAHEAAEIALGLVEAHDRDPAMPPLRVGAAFGPVLARLGDVFGNTVNLASRLTALVDPGGVLVDAGMGAGLTGRREFVLRAMGPLAVRGFDEVPAFTVIRAAGR
ncbi:adenylate/guanylate cyclase domain-containing protein [Actinomadura craniellae]|uniref:Adenylate/guanylate cyclase domain-containing protein n=1 Tax=Actinomadura craniellae TaxID=2231787 RepID=A0A365GWJ5_9ACTN|nr:adenylate/guanylate cyclase domain-containing protein [Actinomadura craniellae]RAY11142.1 adenylate/guanylate cyclase domain-containing protein [Actinomadura craniellae]